MNPLIFHSGLPRRLAAAALSAAVVLAASAWTTIATAAVTAQLQPQSLSVGESARLTVTVQGSGNDAPDIPEIPGLNIDGVGSQSSMSIRNGVMTSNATRIYRVTPDHAGTFTIPAISAGSAGSSQPLTLTVSAGAGQPPGGPTAPPPAAVKDDGKMPDKAKELPAFLRVVLPKTELTVGEIVPVKIKAYFRAGMSASLGGPPTLSSDAFALSKLSDRVARTMEKVDGVPFTVLTWTSSLSAVKAGDYPLNMDLPVVAQIPDRSQRASGRNRMRDMFGDDGFPDMGFDDPIFDQVFGRTTRKEMKLHTDGAEIKISEVPVTDRPADFTGAVGKFDLSATADTPTGTTGDPLTLKLAITGNGDFNRVSTSGLDAAADWKTYSPSGTFAPSDISGLSGTKTFSQSIIPLKAGSQSIPPVTFSYFDPDTKSFVTRLTDPIPINIKQGIVAPAPTPAAVTTAAADQSPKTPEPGADGLMPDKAVPVGAGTSLRPLVQRPWFIALNATLAGALLLGAILRQIRARFAAKPRQPTENALQESVAAMDAAMQTRDAPRFFAAARRAIQEHLATLWKVPAAQVTLPEIRSRLTAPQSGELRALFETADEIAYAGSRHTPTDLQQWRDLVQTHLRRNPASA